MRFYRPEKSSGAARDSLEGGTAGRFKGLRMRYAKTFGGQGRKNFMPVKVCPLTCWRRVERCNFPGGYRENFLKIFRIPERDLMSPSEVPALCYGESPATKDVSG